MRRFAGFYLAKTDRRLWFVMLVLFLLAIFYHQLQFGWASKTTTPSANDVDISQKHAAKAFNKRFFTVEEDTFLKDGKVFIFRGGMAHYWRRPPEYWDDTMVKIKHLGLNSVQTYISWNLHEPEPETYDFEGALDVAEYFRVAQKHGLFVILRPGPFINAEVDKGGFPYWLMRLDPKMKLRTSDSAYFQYVEKYYRQLMPIIKPFLYSNGGPIILVQIENEYGSYPACDMQYRTKLRDLTRQLLGPDILLYTTDGPQPERVRCGRVEGAVTTIDFGPGSKTLELVKIFRASVPVGPFANSEFYPGWINHWSREWNTLPSAPVVQSTKELLALNASFTYYPLVGGTNFGFTVGSNVYKDTFLPGTTSYDFDAPVSEGGDLTEKYWKLREVFKKAGLTSENEPAPPLSAKRSYGVVKMKYSGSVFDNLPQLSSSNPTKSKHPITFEELKHPYGFVLYRTTVKGKFRDPASLNIPGIGDRATVFVNEKPVGVLSRTSNLTAVNIFIKSGQVLDILVQNEGRITVGNMTGDFKGISGSVKLQNQTLTNWEHYPLSLPSWPVKNPKPLDLLAEPSKLSSSQLNVPAFFTGTFRSDPPQDTFLRLDNWHQGYAFINGYNIGRYWPVQGPQMTLFIPSVFLNNLTDNVIQLFEIGQSPCLSVADCVVELVDKPDYGTTTVYKFQPYDAETVLESSEAVSNE